jgi:glycosyltransferase involved in cell wall biosynthesis
MQNSNEPLVSIIAANYNNAKYVIDTLNSISNQDYPAIELIIIDDKSTDDSLSLIEDWLPNCKFPVRLLRHSKNLGLCAVCNHGLKYSEGKYVCMIATDDIMLPARVRQQVDALEKASVDVCAVYSDMSIINAEGLITGDSYFTLIKVDNDTISDVFKMNIMDRLAFLIEKNIFPAPSMFYKRDIIKKIGGWDEALSFEDLDMNLRLTRAGYKFLWLNERLVQYRYTQVSMSRKPNPVYLESHLKAISKHEGLSEKIDNCIKPIVIEHAQAIYKLNGKKASFWLRKSFQYQKRKKTLLMLLTSSLNISYYSVFKA